MNTSMDSLSIEIQSVAKNASNGVDILIAKLDKLRTSLQSVIKESNSFSQLKDNLEVASKTASVRSPATRSFSKPLEAAADVGFEGDDLGNSNYAKLKSTVVSTNSEIRKYILNNNNVLTVTKRTKNGVDNYTASMRKLADESKNTSSRLGSLKISAAIGAGIVAIKKMTSNVGDYVKKAADYEEAMNLFMVTLADRAETASIWVKEFSDALYLDPANVMQYMGSFNALTKGLGVGGEKAYIMSKNLTQLTYDLASFKNLSFEESFRKLQSAISGEIEPLRNVGVALSQATLQELANSMGIKQRVADMSEADKAQLRYIQILKSTSDWQTDMARTLVTPANALRILQQQFTLLARAIGNIFIPILMEIIPYVMVLTQALTALANKLAKLLGYKIQDVDYSRVSTGLSGISDGIQDIGSSADSTTKKLNTMLAPFDELNVVQNRTESAGGGSGIGGVGSSLDLPLPEYDALDGLTSKLSERMEDARANLEKLLPIIVAIGGAFAAWKIGKSVANFIKWYSDLPGVGKAAARIGLSIGLIFLGFGASKQGDKDVLNEKTLLKGVGEQIAGSTGYGLAAGLLTKSVTVGLFVGLSFLGFRGSKTASQGDWENGLTGLIEQGISVAGITGLAFKISGGNPVVTLGVAAVVTWANVSFDLAELAKLEPTWEELYDAIFVELNPFYDLSIAIGDFVYDFTKEIGDLPNKAKDFGEQLKNEISNKWDDIKNNTSLFVEDVKTKITTKWDEIKTNTTTKWDEIKTTLNNGFTNIKDSASEKFENIKNTISDKWTSSKNWLSNNIGTKDFWKEKFDNINIAAGEILDKLKSKFENWKANLKTPHIKWDSDGIKAGGALKKVLETLNLPTTLPKLKVSWYAEGGFPKSGDFFVANENGPEMIGKIGNRSAVANNDQIETSLTNALITALNSYNFGDTKNPTIIYIGNKKVYEGYGEYMNSENDRYGTTTVRI